MIAIAVAEQGELRSEIASRALLLHGAEPLAEFLQILDPTRADRRLLHLRGDMVRVGDATNPFLDEVRRRQAFCLHGEIAAHICQPAQ